MIQRFFFEKNFWLKELNLFRIWLKELNPSLNMTHRNFLNCNSKNWFLSSNMTHKTEGIESSFSEWLEDLNFIFQMSQWIKTLLKKKKMTRRIDLLKNISQIIETFWWLKELNTFVKKTVTHRTEPFFHMIQRIEPFFPTWRVKNWTLLFNMTQRIEPFFLTCLIIFFAKNIQRIEPSFEYDSKNWTFSNMTPKIELFLNMIHRNEPFFQHYSKDGTFESTTQRIGHFLIWLKELNLLFYTTPRTELFLLEEINFFFSNLNQRIDFFKNFTSNYWPFFFEYDSQNWTLLTRLKDLRTFLHESKNSNTFLK